MSYTALAAIINILFIVILLAGFFVGFWRGIKKSSLNIAFAIVGVLIAFFITIPISNAILSIQITTGESTKALKIFLLDMILTGDIKTMVDGVPSLKTLIQGLPVALVSVVMFIVLTALVEGVMYIIYKIFAFIFFRNKNKHEADEDAPKPKKHRVWGGVVGLAKTLIVLTFAVMPLTSLCSVVSMVSAEENYVNSPQDAVTGSEEIQNIVEQYKIVFDGAKAFKNSGFGFFAGIFGIDNAVFDYFATVNVDGQNISVRNEIATYWQAYQVYDQISQSAGKEGFEYASINFDKVDGVVQQVYNSGLYKTVVADLVKDVLLHPEEYDFIPLPQEGIIKDLLDVVKSKITDDMDVASYLTHDVDLIYKTVRSLCESKVLDQSIENFSKYFDGSTPEEEKKEILPLLLDTLTKQENFETTKQMFANLFDTHVVRAGADKVASMFVEALLGEVEKFEVDTSKFDETSWKQIADNFALTIKCAKDLLQEVDLKDIMPPSLDLLTKEDFNLTSVFTNLGALIDSLKDNLLIGNFIETNLLEKNGLSLPEEYFEDENPIEITSYTQLFTQVYLPSLTKLSESGLYDKVKQEATPQEIFKLIAQNLKSEEYGKTYLADILLPLYQVQPDVVTSLLEGMSNDFIDFTQLKNYQDWNEDLNYISDLLVALSEVDSGNGIDKLFGEELDTFLKGLGQGEVSKVVAPILKARSTSALAGQIASKISQELSSLAQESITVSFDRKYFIGEDDQTEEVCVCIEKYFELAPITLLNIQQLLVPMKVNAERSGTEGVFKQAYDTINAKAGSLLG